MGMDLWSELLAGPVVHERYDSSRTTSGPALVALVRTRGGCGDLPGGGRDGSPPRWTGNRRGAP